VVRYNIKNFRLLDFFECYCHIVQLIVCFFYFFCTGCPKCCFGKCCD